ncbi:MAG: YkgJ family cysteine cluster protein [Methanomicrobiales archaeon]|nr:YkgJ family cysteine cluster protein [Methanomicrobiales archaeon]
MIPVADIAREIQRIGFRCQRCGICCSPVEPDSNIVMVTPPEIRRIMQSSALAWDEIAEPYPGKIPLDTGNRVHLGWCIRRHNHNCVFLEAQNCRIYHTRPGICRTYPFELSDTAVMSSPCPGLGQEISFDDAMALAQCLVDRYREEARDENQIRAVFQSLKNGLEIPAGTPAVIDCEGVKILGDSSKSRR